MNFTSQWIKIEQGNHSDMSEITAFLTYFRDNKVKQLFDFEREIILFFVKILSSNLQRNKK